MIIDICVGSSCHLKGSPIIIEMFQKKLQEHDLVDQVELRAAFCLGKCTTGVSIRIDEDVICAICEANFDEIFDKYVLKK